MTDRSFQHANAESRERLARLVGTLTPSQLEVELGGGWTVASALAHMVFWDRWQAARWSETLAGTGIPPVLDTTAPEAFANVALEPLLARISSADLAALVVESAEAVDGLAARAPDALVDAIEGAPSAYLLHRHRHRNEHLDQIERGLAAVSGPLDRSFVEKNAASRRRMASIVERLRAEDMTRPTEPTEEGSWTIAQALGHLAFWDRSMAVRWQAALDKAGDGGPVDIVGIPMDLTDAINLPLAGLIDAWTGRLGLDIANEALAAAEAVDALVEKAADRLPPAAVAARPNAVNRWSHRESHLEAVERALAVSRPGAAPVDEGYLERNEASRAAVKELLGGLSASDLARPMGDGSWTVGQVIGHLAFWDRFLAARWRAALAGGTGGQPSHLPHELADLLNDGLPPAWAAFAGAADGAVIAEAIAAAEEIDAIIAGLPAQTPIAEILAERPALLDRSVHRYEHLDQIRHNLGR